jgi:hypothetical protein
MVNSLPANLPDANSPPWKPLRYILGNAPAKVKAHACKGGVDFP